MTWKLACLIVTTLTFTLRAHAQGNAPEPEGYRTDNYRAPVPATLADARVLATEEAEAIWRAGAAIFIDVLPHPPSRKISPQARSGARNRGSTSLVASGCRTPVMGRSRRRRKTICRHGLARASGGNNAKLLV